ncbi:MAG: aromatic compound degradation protein PaaI [Rhodoglobus sp.]|nr:aromatic compound degradation protein PaaI [Rhodoglobus sp.]
MSDRTKTITWQDPMIGAKAMTALSGLDYMRALLAGEYPPPPILEVMNLHLESVEVGTVTFTAQPDESHYNPIGAVHGGFACTVLDSVAGCAVQTTLPLGFGYTSLEIKVNYLAGITATTGPLTAVGTVIKPGKRVAFAEGVLTDSSGKVVATASSTLLVFPIPPQAG